PDADRRWPRLALTKLALPWVHCAKPRERPARIPRPRSPDTSSVLLDDDLRREEELDRGVRVHPRNAEVGCRPNLRRARAGDGRLAVHAVAFALRLGERE